MVLINKKIIIITTEGCVHVLSYRPTYIYVHTFYSSTQPVSFNIFLLSFNHPTYVWSIFQMFYFLLSHSLVSEHKYSTLYRNTSGVIKNDLEVKGGQWLQSVPLSSERLTKSHGGDELEGKKSNTVDIFVMGLLWDKRRKHLQYLNLWIKVYHRYCTTLKDMKIIHVSFAKSLMFCVTSKIELSFLVTL